MASDNEDTRSFRRVAVYVIEARHLLVADVAGASDPYCKLQLGPMSLETEVVRNTTNPKWHEALFFMIPVLSYRGREDLRGGGRVSRDDLKLRMQLFDSDAYKWDDPLGSAEVDIAAAMGLVKPVSTKPPKDGEPEAVTLPYDQLYESWVRLHDGGDGMVHIAVYLPPKETALKVQLDSAANADPATPQELRALGGQLSEALRRPARPVRCEAARVALAAPCQPNEIAGRGWARRWLMPAHGTCQGIDTDVMLPTGAAYPAYVLARRM